MACHQLPKHYISCVAYILCLACLPEDDTCTSVVTGSGHPDHLGQPGHILPGSMGSDPLYKVSGSDPDFA